VPGGFLYEEARLDLLSECQLNMSDSVNRRFAPIALFTFKRPEHTQRTLEALARNPEFALSELHIFCDGSRRPNEDAAVEATREIARNFPHPNKTLHEAPANRGLAASITEGVSRLCAEHGRVIVVEDDLVVAPVFLDFLNRGLVRYADDERVMQISGHMFPVELPPADSDAALLPFTTSWGWATWQRAWQYFDPTMRDFDAVAGDRAMRKRFDLGNAYPYFSMLKKQKSGQIDSWAIRWYLSVFMCEGLVLFPRRSLVNNEGFDGSGTHCADEGEQQMATLPTVPLGIEVLRIECDEAAAKSVGNYLSASRRPLKKVFDFYQRNFSK
jgi:hypothetical protein